MDIIRPSIGGPRYTAEVTARQSVEPAPQAAPVRAVSTNEARPDALHSALQALPDVDLDRVAALRQALQDGTLDTSPETLAADMLAFHRSDR